MPRAARRTSKPLVVTGTTDSFQRKAVNIRALLTQKIRQEKAAIRRRQKYVSRMEAALKVLGRLKPRNKER